jgi:hypothetical protein
MIMTDHFSVKLQNFTLLLLVIVFATSCSNDSTQTDRAGCPLPSGYKRVLISPTTPYQNWQVRVTARGLAWNGISTDEKELELFAQQLAKLPASSGSAVFEVNKSSSCESRFRVRSALLRSGLCKQGRCWELEGVVKAPTVY